MQCKTCDELHYQATLHTLRENVWIVEAGKYKEEVRLVEVRIKQLELQLNNIREALHGIQSSYC
jgi:hypothetical protein